MLSTLVRGVRGNRLGIATAIVVLSIHAAGVGLSGRRIGPTFVLAVTSALALGLWLTARAGRTGPLPDPVRMALLVVWLFPLIVFWGFAVYAWAFPAPPNLRLHDALVRAVEPRAAPDPAA